MTEIPTHKLTNGDLDGMDAGELREHITAYAIAHKDDAGLGDVGDDYFVSVVQRIEYLAGDDSGEITIEIWEDVQNA